MSQGFVAARRLRRLGSSSRSLVTKRGAFSDARTDTSTGSGVRCYSVGKERPVAAAGGRTTTGSERTTVSSADHWPPALVWKLPMTYAVPFIVATLGALGTGKVPSRP
jgi:hypothetical protein